MKKRNIVDDPGHEPVNPFRFDFDIPFLRYVQVQFLCSIVSHCADNDC